MKDDISLATSTPGRRAASYWFLDGLPDIVLGGTLFVFAALGLGWCIRRSASATRLDFLFLAAGFCLFFWKGRALVEFCKSRLTYPRTGYVQPPREIEKCPAVMPLSLGPSLPPDENVTRFERREVLIVFWWCYLIAVGLYPWQTAYLPWTMPVLAAALYAANRKSENPFRWWSALLLALTGPAMAWLDIPPRLQPPALPLLAGAWLMAQGALTLLRYLRANPYPRGAEGVRA
jgi:hypothetical protein